MKEHTNKALKVTNKSMCRSIGTYDGDAKFKTNGVILLFDQFDKQYTTKQFFFNICENTPDGPGPFSKHFCIALRQFFVIFLFLLFVTLVVLAFGDSYSVSFPNQLLATLAGGVVPWILMKTNILFSQADPPDVDEICERYFYKQKNPTSNSSENSESNAERLFKKTFDNEIEKDSKWWIIGDMDVADDEIDDMTVTVEPTKETKKMVDITVTVEPPEETKKMVDMTVTVEPPEETKKMVDMTVTVEPPKETKKMVHMTVTVEPPEGTTEIGFMNATVKPDEERKGVLLVWKGRKSTCTKRKAVEEMTEKKYEEKELIKKDQ
ncbi:uncharacterized protein LOC127724212 isoform X2 [Mytilus californianus]|uniref:uncharacterized protein LOC127724212 isoform X2 n=1 Tax=Mytilus californianus TaxID=6549 RepID=UPI002245A4AF|nr:uncharacterized protein LOC127724212 isoform X2 [Mytilus californianus]